MRFLRTLRHGPTPAPRDDAADHDDAAPGDATADE
jgi:hypothetical protein